MTNAAPRIGSLPEIEAAIWRELDAAARHKGHEWRVMAMATVGGGRAHVRSMVVREVQAESRELIFYTDARSPKLRQLDEQPEGALLLWSRSLGWQLRLRVALATETSGLAVSSRWAQLKMTPAAQDYLSPLAPGSEIEHPVPERGSRDYFAMLSARVLAIDWLELHAEGQRRARFDETGSRWLAP
jgi:hypothetical protein